MALQPAFRRSILFVLVCVTLCFGWWPFSFTGNNDIGIDAAQNAIRFNERHEAGNHAARGVAYSDQTLDTRGWDGITVSIELRGRWNGAGLGVFLELFGEGPDGKREVTIAQWKDHLALRSRRTKEEVAREYSEIGYKDLFAGNNFVELTLSSEGRRTHVYVNGKIVESRSDFPLVGPSNSFAGLIAVGNSSDGKSPFKGEIRRAAVYRGFHKPSALGKPSVQPVWSFNGAVASLGRDGMPQVPGLVIPEKFRAGRRSFFNPIGEARWERHGFISDVVVNSLGFIPVGICFAAAARRRVKGFLLEAVVVALASFALSLLIESGQGFLVQRDSSQLDILLNTMSGTLGVLIPRRWVLFL